MKCDLGVQVDRWRFPWRRPALPRPVRRFGTAGQERAGPAATPPYLVLRGQIRGLFAGFGEGASAMNGIIYLVGLVVVVAVILSFLGVF